MSGPEEDTQLDKILHSVGDNGRYQQCLFWLFLVPITTMIPWTTLVAIFQTSVPDHWCHVAGRPEGVPVELWKNWTIPWEESEGRITRSQCEQYDEAALRHNNQNITECEAGWDFDQTWYSRTVATDRAWVCGRGSRSARWLSAGFAGNVVGTLIFNPMSDHLGRKPVVILSSQVYSVFAVVRLFVSSEWALLATMFVSSMTFPSLLTVSLIWALEQISGEVRAQIMSVSFIMWTVGMCLVPLLAWLTRNWVLLGIVTSLPFIPYVAIWWLFPESPRWLLSRGRVEEALKAFQRIAKINGNKCPDDLLSTLTKLAGKEEKGIDTLSSESNMGFLELFKFPVLRKRLLLLTLCYICNNSMYYGIIYNTANISGNEFLNFFYLSISELPGNFLGWICAQKLGRRFSQSGFFFLATLTAIVAIFVSENDSLLEVFVLVTCKTLSNISFLVVYIQLPEMLPTTHRAAGTGFATVVSSIVGISTPYIAYSAAYMRIMPYLILVIIGAIGAIAALFLPETMGHSLPQTISDAENFLTDQPFWSYLGWRPGAKRTREEKSEQIDMCS